jgi:hypothetical protein
MVCFCDDGDECLSSISKNRVINKLSKEDPVLCIISF